MNRVGDLQKLLSLTEPAERRRLAWLAVGMLVLGVLEAIGVSSMLPFIAVLANPKAVESNRFLAALYSAGNFQSVAGFLTALGLCAIALIIAANTFGLFINWKIVQIANDLGHAMSMRVIRCYAGQPYPFYLSRLSTNLSLNSTDEVAGVINGVLIPALQLMVRLIVASFLILLILLADPMLACVLALVFGGAYAFVFRAVRKRLLSLGQQNQEANRSKFRIATTLFQGIKDLKVLGRVDHYLRSFEADSLQAARKQSLNSFLVFLPRYAIETIAVVGMLAVALYLLRREQEIGRALPLLALYGFAAYRLMPALQSIFASFAQIRFNLPSLHLLHEEMKTIATVEGEVPAAGAAVPFERSIELRDVHFSFPEGAPILAGLSLTVPRNCTVGVVGTTGAGKTTLVDLMLGLLTPVRGELLVDGRLIDAATALAWRRKIGYVTQFVYLSDESVARNIAFGLPADEVDMGRVREAARVANIHEFIERELPQGYETPTGERGARLSGGQRQRLGIARALYRDPEVLILDEATSSLDSITEDAVIDAIRQLSHRKTIIAVAHRLTTLKDCDLIYMVAEGRVADSGTFEELLARNNVFRAMAKA
ncbi:MAG: ATP-binding cassette, subfamily bacterial PglK [Betaproteobacteria bacterium]|nr:ATP-binding cassette, subfamily bacterial PglK [Betaproteobacteria bacterium]